MIGLQRVIGPNLAFFLAITGILAIYCEFIRPGRILPGAIGSACLASGIYSLWRHSPGRTGLVLMATAALLFIIEAVSYTHFVAGISGTVALAAGSCVLYAGSRRIAPALGISLSVAFGATTTLLAYAGRKARENKRSDL